VGGFNGDNSLGTEADHPDDGPGIREVGLPHRYCLGYRDDTQAYHEAIAPY